LAAEQVVPFCEKHVVQKLEVFGSVAEGTAKPGGSVDLLVIDWEIDFFG